MTLSQLVDRKTMTFKEASWYVVSFAELRMLAYLGGHDFAPLRDSFLQHLDEAFHEYTRSTLHHPTLVRSVREGKMTHAEALETQVLLEEHATECARLPEHDYTPSDWELERARLYA